MLSCIIASCFFFGRFDTDELGNKIPELNVHVMTTKPLRIKGTDLGNPIPTVINMVKVLLSGVRS